MSFLRNMVALGFAFSAAGCAMNGAENTQPPVTDAVQPPAKQAAAPAPEQKNWAQDKAEASAAQAVDGGMVDLGPYDPARFEPAPARESARFEPAPAQEQETVALGDYDALVAPKPVPVELVAPREESRPALVERIEIGQDTAYRNAAQRAPEAIHIGDYDARAAGAPQAEPEHLGDYAAIGEAAEPALKALQPVDLGDYDAPLSQPGRYSESYRVQPVAAAPMAGGMAPVYDEEDFAPRQSAEPRRRASIELSAPPPRRGGAVRQSSYDGAFARQLAHAAKGRTRHRVRYDGRYVKIGYPWGDVPGDIGVCTDVVVRSYRALGIDLQELVHEDMRTAFSDYPSRRIYGNQEPDSNIDHRRVVNLERFFERMGAGLPPSNSPSAYQPGDLVTFRISGKQPHIGLVTEEKHPQTGNYLIAHNIGSGPRLDDMLDYEHPVGHYRFTPAGGGGRYASASPKLTSTPTPTLRK